MEVSACPVMPRRRKAFALVAAHAADLDAPKDQAEKVEGTRGKRTPRSPSEHLEAKTHETKLMSAVGASRAETDSSTALPGTAMGCGLDGSRGITNDAGILVSHLLQTAIIR